MPRAGEKISIYTLPLHFDKVLTGSHGGEADPARDIPRYVNLHRQGRLRLGRDDHPPLPARADQRGDRGTARRRNRRTHPDHADLRAPWPTRLPTISFIVTALNEEAHIEETVRTVNAAAAGLVSEFEIVLVDDGSTDRTGEHHGPPCRGRHPHCG